MTQTLVHADVPAFLPAGTFVRFAVLDWDGQDFADAAEEGRRRKVKRLIKRSGDSPISARHNLVLGTLDSAAGNTPPLHSHDYPEIFIPVRSGYRIGYGTDGHHSVNLGLYDAISVPENVLRLFEATAPAGHESQMLSIFDTALEDFREGITVTPELRAADIAAGIPFHPQERVSTDMVDIAPEVMSAKYVARYADLPVEQEGGLRLRRLIDGKHPRAALRTPHNIAVDYVEVPAGATSEACRSECREVFIALEGQPQIVWNDQAVPMERLDIFSIAPTDRRAIKASGQVSALMLRIRDLTNPR